jgi:hypothetical protein
MRQTARRKGPLSFADLSATIVDAQKATGFVDTLTMEKPHVSEVAKDQISDTGIASVEAVDPGTVPPEALIDTITPDQPPTNKTAATDDDRQKELASVEPQSRRGRVRAPIVQCNLKITEALRDALHLQALRERRTIADLVTEVMTEYLTQHGTFERLR